MKSLIIILSKFYTVLLTYVVILDNIIGIWKTPIWLWKYITHSWRKSIICL